ncbi:MAG: 50S ribosomal protein L18 [Spirochaetes bacterium]|nr:50S ribosomal protein L18 [Spirochaetota bacterium]
MELQKKRRLRRKRIIRKQLAGTLKKPRLSVFKSNKYIYVQAINDDDGNTIAASSSLNLKAKDRKLNKDVAFKVGEEIAKKLLEKKINEAVFDRNGFLYIGRVKSLADGARKQGIKF